MASTCHPVLYICRSCRQGVQHFSPGTRSFSTSLARPKVIPSFTSTPSPELDELLLAWRQKVFMPAALQNHHRALIYKQSRHQTLINEPGVTVTMSNDEKIKLEPMNFYDKPNKKKSLRTILDILSDTDSDAAWKNLPAFLAGMVLAKEPIPTFFFEKITRKASEMGKERIIIRCAERADETGLKVSKKGVARELMLGLHTRAALADFKGDELEVATRRAERVARMLEDELNGAEKLAEDQVDARKSPLVASVLTELAAAKAVNGLGSDVDKITNYATKMLHLASTNPQAGSVKPALGTDKIETRAHGNILLEDLLPLQSAIMLTLELDSIKKTSLGKQLTAQLKRTTSTIEESLKTVRKNADGQPRRGLEMYDQLHGTQYNEAATAEAGKEEV